MDVRTPLKIGSKNEAIPTIQMLTFIQFRALRHFHGVDLYISPYIRQNEAIPTVQISIFEAIPTI